ncbi:hypothetical protein [Bacillus solimangrovi]|uniref:Uncharacterized protein n=1 Tax=Bacillus solimangrovi TaxID=1305675 RepID=A0A1E5LAV0_9BACI|nr:hypothetical protein [Bacillus solimangrovi]OEH91129.1 hypothetical protein BFG57_07090 [Bacillus solimangrovi]
MTIHVVPSDFATVQEAIDDVGTMPGDSIQILAGTTLKNNAGFDIEAVGGLGTNVFDGNICGNSSHGGLCI